MLLAPGGSKSLASIGNLYGEAFKKIKISKVNLKNMKKLLKEEVEMFIDYALRDALIYLTHALWLEDLNYNIGGTGIPLITLNDWEKIC
jgi:hypothetical protein